MRSRYRFIATSAFLMFGFASEAGAADGTVLINQTKALAGNVTPGDAPGFPVTLSRIGSYRLSSNLNPPLNTKGIEFTANNITLDLNGFTVVGNTSGPVFTPGLSAVGRTRITIKNGNIIGFGFGILMSTSTAVTVEGLTVETTGNGAIYTGINSNIRNNVFGGTPAFQINCPSVVTGNVFMIGGNNGAPTATCAKANNINF